LINRRKEVVMVIITLWALTAPLIMALKGIGLL